TFETVPLLMVASFWYLAMTSVLTVGQYYLERRFARGALREPPTTPVERVRRWFRRAYLARSEPPVLARSGPPGLPGLPGRPGPGR
ncbi:MAG: polar amino acid transport system permease protein, partial [Acidimicrobiaceae bacterium]|nr:polar amino acid transport system permease protein [Acidimicrobiaceae bacterium]